jgi:glycosyltransferase involved in cell wall biosynthesis
VAVTGRRVSQTPPRLLIVNWQDIRNPEAGGAEIHLHEVARRLVRDGWYCALYSHAFPGAPAEETIDGVRIHRIGRRRMFNFVAGAGIRRWCRRHDAEVVLDDYNKIPFLLPLLAPVPVVAQVHHLFGRVLFQQTTLPSALYVLAFEKLMPLVYRRTRILTGSESSRQELLARGCLRVEIAPEGVDLEHHRPMPGVRRSNLVLYVGRIKRYKRLDFLLDVALRVRESVSDLELLIAGRGDDLDRLRALARDRGMTPWTRFLGFVDEAEKVRLYREATVVVNPSLKEGWGLSSIEANACGTPVVACDVPGLRDSVRHGETGYLAPSGDVQQFADAVDRVLRAPPALVARLREGALAWAARHSWEQTYQVTRDALSAARLEGRDRGERRRVLGGSSS